MFKLYSSQFFQLEIQLCEPSKVCGENMKSEHNCSPPQSSCFVQLSPLSAKAYSYQNPGSESLQISIQICLGGLDLALRLGSFEPPTDSTSLCPAVWCPFPIRAITPQCANLCCCCCHRDRPKQISGWRERLIRSRS